MKIKIKDEQQEKLLQNKFEEIKEEIILSAFLKLVYCDKNSKQKVQVKVNHQLNAIKNEMHQINPRFQEKSKHYDKVNEEIIKILERYEKVLKQFANRYDEKIKELVLQKVEIESKLLMAIVTKEYLYKKELKEKNKPSFIKSFGNAVEKIKSKTHSKEPLDVTLINRVQDQKEVQAKLEEDALQSEEYKENCEWIVQLEKELKDIQKRILNLDEEKINKIFEAMEVGGKELSINIRKPRKIAKITKFFVNRLNTYHVILKNIIEPMNHRIDEFQVNELNKVEDKIKECDFEALQEQIRNAQNQVLKDFQNKVICKEMGLFSK